MKSVMPKDQTELREIVRRAVGNKMRKLMPYVHQIERQSNHWKLDYKSLLGHVRYLERRLREKQARIDALMLEYCPGEMTEEQKAEWPKHQRPESNG